MFRRGTDIVVIGGSAGALTAVIELLRALPATCPAALFIALHQAPDERVPGRLSDLLSVRAALPTRVATDEEPIRPGHVYVAPADHHMVLQNGYVRLERSPIENRFRPCADVLFKSAASTYGRRVIGVLLSGKFGSDGTAGLWQIKQRGGLTIVQDPSDARFPAMPRAAIDNVAVDYVLPVREIAPKLMELSSPDRAVQQDLPRILIVEDEGIVASDLQQSLSDMGYAVIDWVPSGEAAIEVAEREAPDLILMDIGLSGSLSGVEAARRIWHAQQTPIVYCTAFADLETLKAVQTTESYGYLVKPIQGVAVRAAIELALARREKELR